MARAKPTRMVRVADGIYRRNGMLIVRVSNPDKGRGGRDNHSVPIGDDYPVALRAAKDLKAEKDRERAQRRRLGHKQHTVRSWMDVPRDDDDKPIPGALPMWLELTQKKRPKESTRQHNVERSRGFVKEHGSKKLHEVTPMIGTQWGVEHPGTVKVLRAAYNDAKRLGLVAFNPFDGVETEPPKGMREMPHALTRDELGLLLRCAERSLGGYGERMFAPMLEFEAWAGLRSGERYALDVDDVDFENGVIRVYEQFNSKLGKRTETKEWEQRETVLLPEAAAALRRISPWPESGEIFRTVEDVHLRQSSESWYWQQVRNAFMAELPAGHWLHDRVRRKGERAHLTIYELRHFFGTELAHNGCTEWEIAEQMGHKDPAVTKRYYVHLEGRRVRESVQEKMRRGRAA